MKGILHYYLLKHSFGFDSFCFNHFNFLDELPEKYPVCVTG